MVRTKLNRILTNLHMVDIPYARQAVLLTWMNWISGQPSAPVIAKSSAVLTIVCLLTTLALLPSHPLPLFHGRLQTGRAHAVDAFPPFLSIPCTPGLVVLLLHLGGILGLPLSPRHWCSGLFIHLRSTDFNPAARFCLMTFKK